MKCDFLVFRFCFFKSNLYRYSVAGWDAPAAVSGEPAAQLWAPAQSAALRLALGGPEIVRADVVGAVHKLNAVDPKLESAPGFNP